MLFHKFVGEALPGATKQLHGLLTDLGQIWRAECADDREGLADSPSRSTRRSIGNEIVVILYSTLDDRYDLLPLSF